MDNRWTTLSGTLIHRLCTGRDQLIHLVAIAFFDCKLLFYKVFIVLSTGSIALNNNNKRLKSNFS